MGRTLALLCLLLGPQDGLKTETFDRDPGWDGRNHRPDDRRDRPVQVRQDFGYSATSHAGGAAGELGGYVFAAAEPAFYGKALEPRTLKDPLTASGRLAMKDGATHLLLGFFNAETVKEWRTPNTLGLRLNGRGDHFFAYVDYATSKWRAGGESPKPFPSTKDPKTGRLNLVGFPSGGKSLAWSISYDPKAGEITATIDGATSVCAIAAGHADDGASFNRFGILNVMKSADSGGEIYVDDLRINGAVESFDADPRWDGRDNRRTYETRNVRPRFDFGWSETAFAGGRGKGELGGLTFRGDCRYPERLAAYGDRLRPLTLEKPLRAAGKVALRRGVTDSTTLFGFYHSQDSLRSNPSQSEGLPESFAGFAIEGPSREGFYFYPVYRAKGAGGAAARLEGCPRIYPDGAAHDWTFDYDPKGAGRIAISLDGRPATLDLAEGRKAGTVLDRFGLVTTWIDGNGQHVYFDDLTYTAAQE